MLSNLFAAISPEAIALIVCLPLCLAGGILGTYFIYKKTVVDKVVDKSAEAEKMLEEARLKAETLKKEALLEAKDEQMKMRADVDRETKQRRSELQKQESRLNQREDAISKREDALDKKEDALDKKLETVEHSKAEWETKKKEIQAVKDEILLKKQEAVKEVERVAGMSREEAKGILIQEMTEQAKQEAVGIVKEIEAKAVEEGETKAKNIIGLAIQRCAVDHAAEATVSVVELPGEEMKGRIIGRVGRNIKALESVTGVDIIIDDTPDVVTLSSFDPKRREVARLTLQKLVSDGRIHPGRIEEVAERVSKEVDAQIKAAGEDAAFEANVFNLHPELVKLLGKLKFRTSYGQNVLKHSLEVSFLAGLMAEELGADVKICKRAGLLHDIGKAVDHEISGTHIQLGVDLAKRFKEKDAIIHCIAAHHGDVPAETLEAVLVQAADAISGGRPGARRESLENYVKRLTNLEEIANSFDGVDQSFAIQAGREIRVIVKPEKIGDNETYFLAKEIARKLEAELEYPGQIKVSVIRETRSTEIAK